MNMNTLPVFDLTQAISALLVEVYDGPPDPAATWFVDNEPDCGILGLLKRVSAAEASRSVDGSGSPGTTIAANVEHLRWSLANVNGALRGETYHYSWKESWALTGADEAQWDALRRALRGEFETLRDAILKQQDLRGEVLLGVIALVPHAAFHLGILRQMLERIRQG